MLGMGLQLYKNTFSSPPILNQVPGSVASYSLRKISSNATKAIRVRDDTNTEYDIGFVGKNLDASGLLAWLNRNQVASVPLGVDVSPVNGVSDGWVGNVTNSGTGSGTIDLGVQKLSLTGGTQTFSGYGLYKSVDINVVAGSIINISFEYKKTSTVSNPRIIVGFDAYNGASYLNTYSSNGTTDSSVFTTISGTFTTPANTTLIKFYIRVDANNSIGATGDVWVKNVSATITNQSAYVTKWYDQSGNGNDAVQATAGNQPRIVNAGVLEVDANGKPCISYAITANRLDVPNSSSLNISTQQTISVVHNPSSAGGGSLGRIIDKSNGQYQSQISGTIIQTSAGNSNSNMITLSATNIDTIVYNHDITNLSCYKNGVLNVSKGAVAITPNSNTLYIGNSSNSDRSYDGKFTEIILFSTALTDAQRTKLEKNQGRYYGITVS